jgi:uncharacterized membrane protein
MQLTREKRLKFRRWMLMAGLVVMFIAAVLTKLGVHA